MRRSKIALWSWALYDFANSAYAAIIETFIFPAYFVKVIAASKTQGTEAWGLTLGVAGVVIALGGPILGAIADKSGGQKGWMFIFTALNVVACLALWVGGGLGTYLFWVAMATLGAEFAYLFYNAMLPDLAPKEQIGRWSGWGWGFGYIGGTLSLVLSLGLYRLTGDITLAFLLSSLWHALFSLPLFFLTPSSPKKMALLPAIRKGLGQLFFSALPFLRFFIARLFFIDALLTLFAFGGIYAATQFNMPEETVLLFGIALNVAAGIGSFALAYLDDLWGPKNMMLLSLIALILTTTAALLAANEFLFWLFGLLVGVFVGPLQASARSYLAKLAPQERMMELFGYFTLSGKATSFLGPLAISLIVWLTGSIAWGMSVIILFLALGLGVLLTIDKSKETI